MKNSLFGFLSLLLTSGVLASTDYPESCYDLKNRSATQVELCRAYRDNESCFVLSSPDERAICEAYRNRQCDNLKALNLRSYNSCKVYLAQESCGTYLRGFDLEVCQAHREGLCERYVGARRKACLRKYSASVLIIHQTSDTKLLYDFEQRGPYLLLPALPF